MPPNAWHDIDWDLLSRYLAGDCTPDEEAQVAAWIAAAPERRELVEAARRVADPVLEPPIANLKRRVLATAGIERAAAPARRRAFTPPSRSPWRMVLQAAAAVAVVVGGAWSVQRWILQSPSTSEPSASAVHQIATGLGERRSLRFGDGTEVTLGPGSTLRWHADYGRRDRVVQLEGEAVFLVVHDSARPFAVRTERLVARDLGTRFVVRAYRNAAAADVVVAEGVVAVTPAIGDKAADSLVIRHGDRARVAPDGRVTLARGVVLAPYFDWAEGSLVLHDTPLREAAERIARWYGVDVRLEARGLEERPVTASFRYEPASRALEFIAAALNLQVERRDKTYVLRSR